jgi:hypothetical protein
MDQVTLITIGFQGKLEELHNERSPMIACAAIMKQQQKTI